MPVSKNRRKPSSGPNIEVCSSPNKFFRPSILFGFIGTGLLVAGVYLTIGDSDGAHLSVKVPALTGGALKGEEIFRSNCSGCHGMNAAGSKNGPPLIHKIYEPGHHGDSAFYSAVARGVRAHHWHYGNMPPVRGLSTRDVGSIISYVRALQAENGIY